MLDGCAAPPRSRTRPRRGARGLRTELVSPMDDESFARVVAAFQPLSAEVITRADAEEIHRNLRDFFAVLQSWRDLDGTEDTETSGQEPGSGKVTGEGGGSGGQGGGAGV